MEGPEPLQITASARPRDVTEIRRRLAAWVETSADLGFPVESIMHAVGEAVTNVVEHAYADEAPGTGQIDVDAVVSGESLVVRVRDHGRWRERAGVRGRGLDLITRLADSVSIERSSAGSEVRMSWERRSLTAPDTSAPLAQVVVGRSGDTLVIRIAGEIDLSNAEEVQARVMAALVDAEGLVLDLEETGYLDSTGVRVLFRVAEHMRARSFPLQVLVGPTSHTRRVLELTGFELLADIVLAPVDRTHGEPAPGVPGAGPQGPEHESEILPRRAFGGGEPGVQASVPAPPGTPTGGAGSFDSAPPRPFRAQIQGARARQAADGAVERC